MKTFLVVIETRKGDRDDVLGPFRTFKKAHDEVRDYFNHWTTEELNSYTAFESNFSEGKIFTEEVSVEVVERELD